MDRRIKSPMSTTIMCGAVIQPFLRRPPAQHCTQTSVTPERIFLVSAVPPRETSCAGGPCELLRTIHWSQVAFPMELGHAVSVSAVVSC